MFSAIKKARKSIKPSSYLTQPKSFHGIARMTENGVDCGTLWDEGRTSVRWMREWSDMLMEALHDSWEIQVAM